MNNEQNQGGQPDFNRRDFLKGGSLATLMVMLGGVELRAQEPPKPEGEARKPIGPPVNCGVIGCGVWGLEILNTLARLPNAPVVGVCDHYPASLRKGKAAAPNAEVYEDYKKLLENKAVEAVIVATPTHLHREIVEAALAAGKHVYCEAPLAHTIDEARAIALAARKATRQLFQSGLQLRSDPNLLFLLPFIRSGAAGRPLMARAQWHKKDSWRRTAPTSERERALNWRLRKAESPGLIGEIGVHQIDKLAWFLGARPQAVTGFGSLVQWDDGRDVADTVQAVIEFPGSVRVIYDATLGNSFESEYEALYGSDAAILFRQRKAWMFMEADAAVLGWVVYARKDSFFAETGIALVANASKLGSQGDTVASDSPFPDPPLKYALEAFISNTGPACAAVRDFKSSYGEDEPALKAHLTENWAELTRDPAPAAGYLEGYEATVTVIKANEAIVKGEKLAFQKEWFELS